MKSTAWVSDIDILILYRLENDIKSIRKEFNCLLDKFPIDLIFLTHEEESELDFISHVNSSLIINLHLNLSFDLSTNNLASKQFPKKPKRLQLE